MPDVETMMEEVSQSMDMEEEDAMDNAVLVPLRTLMDIDTTVVPRQVPSADATSPTVVAESSAEKVRTRKPRGPCRRYTGHLIEQLFDYVIEQGKTAKEAALLTGINIRTALLCPLSKNSRRSSKEKKPLENSPPESSKHCNVQEFSKTIYS
jgi:hypothetical protein